jgi:hypothetical protein
LCLLIVSRRDKAKVHSFTLPLTTINFGELMMASKNLAQHEQNLKLLESSIREICDHQKQMDHLVRESWTKTMQLFVVADDLRTTRLAFEKVEGQ